MEKQLDKLFRREMIVAQIQKMKGGETKVQNPQLLAKIESIEKMFEEMKKDEKFSAMEKKFDMIAEEINSIPVYRKVTEDITGVNMNKIDLEYILDTNKKFLSAGLSIETSITIGLDLCIMR